jgi:hypothetical protein
MSSVVKPWLFALPMRMQSVSLLALRGCDGRAKHDVSKTITRALRSLIFNNADPINSFIVGNGIPDEKTAKDFSEDLDAYPLHFVMHTIHACEIIGYKHPEKKFRDWWLNYYFALVKNLHLNHEEEKQLDIRLGFTPEEKKALAAELKRKKQIVEEGNTVEGWESGTGTSHQKGWGS